MTVYVDPIMRHATSASPRCFRSGSCHLVADSLEELHAFARRIGMKRSWFQSHGTLPHYDLTPSRREQAVSLGAIELDRREFVERMRRARREGSS